MTSKENAQVPSSMDHETETRLQEADRQRRTELIQTNHPDPPERFRTGLTAFEFGYLAASNVPRGSRISSYGTRARQWWEWYCALPAGPGDTAQSGDNASVSVAGTSVSPQDSKESSSPMDRALDRVARLTATVDSQRQEIATLKAQADTEWKYRVEFGLTAQLGETIESQRQEIAQLREEQARLRAECDEVYRRVRAALGPHYTALSPDLEDAHAGFLAEEAARLLAWHKDVEDRRAKWPSTQQLLLEIRGRQHDEVETFDHLSEHADRLDALQTRAEQAEAHVAQLTQERDEAVGACLEWHVLHTQQRQRAEQAEAQLTRIQAYVQHRSDCKTSRGYTWIGQDKESYRGGDVGPCVICERPLSEHQTERRFCPCTCELDHALKGTG